MYHIELEIKITTKSNTFALYLDFPIDLGGGVNYAQPLW